MKKLLQISLSSFLFFCQQNFLFGQGNVIKLTENKGQWEKHILFKAALDGGSLFVEKDGLVFNFYDKTKFREIHHGGIVKRKIDDLEIKSHAYKIHFENSNFNSFVEKAQQGTDYENFFIGTNQSLWANHVNNYSQVFLRSLYKNVDYEIKAGQNTIKCNFYVKPNSDPLIIQMRYDGVTEMFLKDESLILKLEIGEVIEQRPYAFQVIQGLTKEVKCHYVLKNKILSFDFPEGYDKNYELVIDPLLVFAAQSGSTADNFGMTATYDSHGNLYSGGTAFSAGYPTTTGAFSTSYNSTNAGRTDVVISKYNASGTNLLFSTYIGGSETEVVSSMIVDGNDNLCFYGATGSSDFPMLTNSYDTSFNGGNQISFFFNGTTFTNGTDIYLAKLNSSGASLLGSTFLGGTDNDGLNHVNHKTLISSSPVIYEYTLDSLQFNYGDQYRGEIQIDLLNNIYITSSTRSSDFPTVNANDNSLGGKQDAILAKFNSALTQLLYCTYLGGNQNECGNSLMVTTQMETYVTGGTCSTNFPVTQGVNSTNYNGGKADGFITRFDALGTLLKSTYVGTSHYDQSYFIQSNKSGDIFICGQSLGNMPIVNFGTSVPYHNNGTHQFITRYSTDLSVKKMSTVLGGSTSTIDISLSAFGLDECNNIYLSGWGGNIINGPGMGSMPLSAPTQSTTDGYDFYLMVLDSSITGLNYGSYFGGGLSQEHCDGGTSRIDKGGTFYQSVCAGCGGNDDFPVTSGSWPNTPGNPNHSTNCNNGTFKISSQLTLTSSHITSNINSGCAPLTVNFVNSSTHFSSYVWYVNQATTSSTNANPVLLSQRQEFIQCLWL